MKTSLLQLTKEVITEFSLRGFIFNRLSNRYEGIENMREKDHYRPITGRGRDQWKCLKAHIKNRKKHGNTMSYCHSCPEYFARSSALSNIALVDGCKRGHWQQR